MLYDDTLKPLLPLLISPIYRRTCPGSRFKILPSFNNNSTLTLLSSSHYSKLNNVCCYGYRQATRRGQSFAKAARISLIHLKIIKSKPKARRGGKSGASRGGASNGGGANNNARARYAGAVPKAASGPTPVPGKALGGDAIKVIISNLPMDVTEAAVRVGDVS
jgi:hypothetical protein